MNTKRIPRGLPFSAAGINSVGNMSGTSTTVRKYYAVYLAIKVYRPTGR